MLPEKSSAAATLHLCCCERSGFGLLSEQSDREANECWLNRWVVTLLHWRGFTGDMMHCFTEVVGWQWDHSVGCLCVKCQSVTISEARGVADMRLPHDLNWCLHNSSTALALFHWQFVTSQNFHPPYVSFGTVDSVLLVSEREAAVTATLSLGHPFFFFFTLNAAELQVYLFFERWLLTSLKLCLMKLQLSTNIKLPRSLFHQFCALLYVLWYER